MIHLGKTTIRSRGVGGTRRIIMTDELREELTQAAAATSHAYAVGARNLSVAPSMNSATGIYINPFIFNLIKTCLGTFPCNE